MQKTQYDLKSVKLPYLAGFALRLFVKILESPLRILLIPSLFQKSGIAWLRKQEINEPPTFHPIRYKGSPASGSAAVPENEWPTQSVLPATDFNFNTVHDFAKAYRDGIITPEDVAIRVLDIIEASNSTKPPLRAIITVDHDDVMKQARESSRRIKEGQSLSVLDGVPVAVKDEVDMVPYPTTVGTAFLGKYPCKEDSTVVARMRAAGALLIGKANMHEIGIGVTGLNPNHGTPRNPYAPNNYTGGSSSGPAAAIAAGLCPVSIGTDGGGSIRIPASFCGIVGIKPTFGRISEHGAAPLCWSVAHVGPLAATVTDAALAYAVMAGPDPKDPISFYQPLPTLDGWNRLNLKGLKLGIYWPWFRHASADVVSICENMLKQFESMGAGLQDITIPDLESGRIAHTIIIAGEMAQALNYVYDDHHKEHGADVRMNLALARTFTARDYIQAQRARTRMINNFNQVLEQVDVIVTPTTGLPAQVIPKAALSSGESDLSTLIEIMRFVTPANLTGLPAISFPAGYNEAELPVGMQIIGQAWREPTLFRLALAAEKEIKRKRPQVYYDLLPE